MRRSTAVTDGGADFSATLRRAQGGDPSAVADLYLRFAPRIHAAIRPRLPASLRRRYDTSDVAQSVFAEVLRDLPRLEDRGEAAFASLLHLKAVNKIRRRLKRDLGRGGIRAEVRLGTDEPLAARVRTPDEDAAAGEDDVRLHRLVADADPGTRTMLRMRGEGRSFAAIADALGLPTADAARKRHARAIAELRARWRSDE